MRAYGPTAAPTLKLTARATGNTTVEWVFGMDMD
jgi:hypothetical protein